MNSIVFSSTIFLFFYLPVVLAFYYIIPKKYKNLFLVFADLLFYGWGEPIFVLLIVFSSIFNYLYGLWIEKHRENKKVAKRILWCAIAVNLALLGFFKYANFFVDILKVIPGLGRIAIPSIPLPIGISFYTFRTMSYIIDVYRKEVKAERNIVQFGTYVTLFQLIAGPIVRYKDVREQLKSRNETISQFAKGIRLFLLGLAKKLLLANQMGVLYETLKVTPWQNGMIGSWIGISAFAFQIYFDFSGYSDMACGLGNMFGFEFVKNFQYPYISKSITEFWRRWHISLSTWFRDYVYIPLGGSRKGRRRTIFNLFIVWLLTGAWHGASWNFILWGIYFFVILVMEKLFLLKWLSYLPKLCQHIYAIICILLGWVIFSFGEVPKMLSYLGSMFCLSNGWISQTSLHVILEFFPLLLIAAFCSLPIGNRVYHKYKDYKYFFILELLGMGVVMLLCTSSLVSQGYNAFLYSRF